MSLIFRPFFIKKILFSAKTCLIESQQTRMVLLKILKIKDPVSL